MPRHCWYRPIFAIGLWIFTLGCDRDSQTSALSIEPPHESPDGIWFDPTRFEQLPIEGQAWESLLAAANSPLPSITVADGNSQANVLVLARALVYCRTGQTHYRDQVFQACEDVIDSEGNRGLDLGRELPAYVFAADLVSLPPPLDERFRRWLDRVRYVELDGGSLISIHEDRPNNWGTHCGAARLAIAAYLNDTIEIGRVARVFHGWLGRRDMYNDFAFGGDRSWHFDSNRPVGINPVDAQKDGHNIDGVLPDDQRRGGPFDWPPSQENYAYEALQGALVQAILLDRHGYDVWEWEDRALLRAFEWLHEEAHFPAIGDDTWQPHVINHFYQTSFPSPTPSRPGKNIGWTDWTHSRNETNEDQ